MVGKSLFGLSLAATALSHAVPKHTNDNGFCGTHFKSVVTFGDSYTDDSRLGYFINHNGSAPPVGYNNPANYNSASGGRPWPQYVAQYGGQKIYNYAVSGAVCSNNITPRYFSAIHADFPDIEGYELPAYLADKAYSVNGHPFLDIPVKQTAYAIWIGTNDLGADALLTDSQVPGTNISSYLDCVYSQVDKLYASGARYFVLFNTAPLQLSPLYGLPGAGGVANDNYWPDKGPNITQYSDRMLEQTVTVNDVYEYRTPYAAVVAKKYPGATLANFDVHQLLTNIYNNPSQYLNGTGAPSVEVPQKVCNAADVCTTAADPDAFLWFDDLHPSEQTDRVIAREFLNVLAGNSSYAAYWS